MLALDFDGTIYSKGQDVDVDLLQDLVSIRRRGIKVSLVTGRCEHDLKGMIDLSLFDAVVLENGAIAFIGGRRMNLYPPAWIEVKERLTRLFGGGYEEAIISLPREMEKNVLPHLDNTSRLEFNTDRIMILPSGISKESGLLVLLKELKQPRDQLMCVGDAENDLAMFKVAALKIAVQNSVEALKREADFVTEAKAGKGVSEAISRFIVKRDDGRRG
jgi:phosphoglycolate phosphatase